MINLRQVATYANMKFGVLFERLGPMHQEIDIGATPNDGTGDMVEVALVKTIDNVVEALHQILDRLEEDES
jgi:hypothetical protein